MPYQLSINEISESEGIPANKVKYTISQALKVIESSLTAKDKETILTLLQ